MKIKFLIWSIVILIILTGVGLILYGVIAHYSAEEDMNKLLYERTVEPVDEEELPVSGLSSDMNVEEVKEYKNCIIIESCKIKAPLVEGTMSEDLRLGVGHFLHTPKVGQKGNACYAGHYSTIYNCVFNGIEKLRTWDTIDTYDEKGRHYVYYVVKKYKTKPTNMSVLKQNKDEKKLTLVTCADNGTKRLIIEGILQPKEEIEALKKQTKLDNISNLTQLKRDMGFVGIYEYLKRKKRGTDVNY